MPCYVRGDFNSDGYRDYALLFSAEEWSGHCWYLTTKLLVVASTPDGFELATDLILGTVSGDASIPIEEYWSLTRMDAGQHVVTYNDHGVEVTEELILDADAVYLASLDPVEEALFYMDGGDVFETKWPKGPLAKKLTVTGASGDSARIIPFNKQIEGRKHLIK
jgi:hypothetical protein